MSDNPCAYGSRGCRYLHIWGDASAMTGAFAVWVQASLNCVTSVLRSSERLASCAAATDESCEP